MTFLFGTIIWSVDRIFLLCLGCAIDLVAFLIFFWVSISIFRFFILLIFNCCNSNKIIWVSVIFLFRLLLWGSLVMLLNSKQLYHYDFLWLLRCRRLWLSIFSFLSWRSWSSLLLIWILLDSHIVHAIWSWNLLWLILLFNLAVIVLRVIHNFLDIWHLHLRRFLQLVLLQTHLHHVALLVHLLTWHPSNKRAWMWQIHFSSKIIRWHLLPHNHLWISLSASIIELIHKWILWILVIWSRPAHIIRIFQSMHIWIWHAR